MSIHHYGQIGAGKVVPFIAPTKKAEIIAVPHEIAHLKPIRFEVCGDSFIDEGIADGTLMVARTVFERYEVTPGRLCIVRIAGNEIVMKRVYLTGKGKIKLCASNKRISDAIYGIDDVEIIGLVEGEWKPRQ